MRLIGMLDSPYVRRVAISLAVLGLPFEHESVSVFSTFEQFHAINPVVKAPTLVCDDGEVLMDSSLILQYVETMAAPGPALWAADPLERQHQLRSVGLALAACEKSVQIVYERKIRPAQYQYEAWIERVTAQVLAAYAGLEQEVQRRPDAFSSIASQAAISAAVAWQFTQAMIAPLVPAASHPGLSALSERLEQSAEFRQYQPGGVAFKN